MTVGALAGPSLSAGMKKKTKHPIQDAEERKQAEIEAAWAMQTAREHDIRRTWLDAHLVRQKGRCAYCNILMVDSKIGKEGDRRWSIDHVVPRSKGGEDTQENTVAACAACNTAKGDMDEQLFLGSAVRLSRLSMANTLPNQLSVDSHSKFYDADALSRGVGILFNGHERVDVREYSVSEGWIRIAPGKSRDRYGRPVTIKLKGVVEPRFLT